MDASSRCRLCGGDSVFVRLHGVRDPFRPDSTRNILECQDCGILFTSGEIEPGDYPDEYAPYDFNAAARANKQLKGGVNALLEGGSVQFRSFYQFRVELPRNPKGYAWVK